jgi:hypothetical protein
MTQCDGCGQNSAATRIIRVETYPGSGRAVERKTCEDCYAVLGRPETLAYICQDCGGESYYPELCQACTDRRSESEGA